MAAVADKVTFVTLRCITTPIPSHARRLCFMPLATSRLRPAIPVARLATPPRLMTTREGRPAYFHVQHIRGQAGIRLPRPRTTRSHLLGGGGGAGRGGAGANFNLSASRASTCRRA